MTGYIDVMLVLQSCTDPLHILSGLFSETNATPDDVCNFSNTEFEDVKEVFISVNEQVDIGIKQEVIPGEITFPEIKSEGDEVSYVCYWTHFTSVQKSHYFCDVNMSGQFKHEHS
jgi:hypothetical protein